MGNEHHPELRGFDSYELTLGDELRGERASKGKSLLDVQRDLRIRAEYIDAIENADASAFPFAGFAAGYVRSYARYLDVDPDDVYRRFCEESGFQGVELGTVEPTLGAERAPQQPVNKSVDDLIIANRFAPANARAARIDLGASLRGLASIGVLAALVAGLSFGGYTVIQNLQRVGFAPLPNAPEVLATAPDIASPAQIAETRSATDEGRDAERISLASFYAEQEIAAPTLEPRDGPIASIDPMRSGVFAPPETLVPPEPVEVLVDAPPPVDAELQGLAALSEQPAPLETGVKIFATEDAWVRVRDGERRVLFTGILSPGDRFELPDEATDPVLRAGNAGAVYIAIDGKPHGPLGDGPEVAKNVRLTPDAVRSLYPIAEGLSAPTSETDHAAREVDAGPEAVAQLPQE